MIEFKVKDLSRKNPLLRYKFECSSEFIEMIIRMKKAHQHIQTYTQL
jgi:hypothetical protein